MKPDDLVEIVVRGSVYRTVLLRDVVAEVLELEAKTQGPLLKALLKLRMDLRGDVGWAEHERWAVSDGGKPLLEVRCQRRPN